MEVIDPKIRKRSIAARRLSQNGLKGKAIGEKLKCSTDEANRLVDIGRHLIFTESSRLSDPERTLIKTLGDFEISNLNKGITASPVGWQICARIGKGSSWAASTSRRLRSPAFESHQPKKSMYGFVHHSANGHLSLTSAGWAIWFLITESQP